ncbi:hypothetical protein [Streptomyces spirodelae]|nr:hypothetical protein [Streptomyces spirodelae]
MARRQDGESARTADARAGSAAGRAAAEQPALGDFAAKLPLVLG